MMTLLQHLNQAKQSLSSGYDITNLAVDFNDGKRTSALNGVGSTGVAPRKPSQNIIYTDVRSISMVLCHFKGTVMIGEDGDVAFKGVARLR